MKIIDRAKESISPLISEDYNINQKYLWLSSPSDMGVRRNLGRNGTRFAPKSILNNFKKLSNHFNQQESLILHKTVSSQEQERIDFHKAQDYSSQEISSIINTSKIKNLIHIGGGHDHAYPLMKALEASGITELVILNVDAHLDTRVDIIRHSGTPFRDFTNHTKIKVHLHQYGIHKYANSISTMSELKNTPMKITYRNECHHNIELFNDIDWSNPQMALFFSLDTDALDGALFEGVSAVNHDGLSLKKVRDLMNQFFNQSSCATKILGVYEYNPLYDNLSQKGSRAIASLIYEFLK